MLSFSAWWWWWFSTTHKDKHVKLKACSKIITLTALGFTLTAAGSFYALLDAERNLSDVYQREIESKLQVVGTDLNHYVQLINSDYYELINLSLTNILSLEDKYFHQDPLLAFYDTNLRMDSAYKSGDNLYYALEALTYFKIPFVSYDFKTGKTNVIGSAREDEANRILRARAEDGTKLSDLIKEKPTLSQTFGFFYSGTDTYLCLKIYDKTRDTYYFALSSYLTVLENITLDVNHVFSDIDPMMKAVLGDDAVMIVRRNKPIFRTDGFTLDIDLDKIKIRDLLGVSVVDKNGNIITDLNSATPENATIVAASYIRSISSFIILQRPYNVAEQQSAGYTLSKIAIILISLLFIALISRVILKDRETEDKSTDNLDKVLAKLGELNYSTYQDRFKKAHEELSKLQQEEAAAKAAAIATGLTTNAADAATAASGAGAGAETNANAAASAKGTNATAEGGAATGDATSAADGNSAANKGDAASSGANSDGAVVDAASNDASAASAGTSAEGEALAASEGAGAVSDDADSQINPELAATTLGSADATTDISALGAEAAKLATKHDGSESLLAKLGTSHTHDSAADADKASEGAAEASPSATQMGGSLDGERDANGAAVVATVATDAAQGAEGVSLTNADLGSDLQKDDREGKDLGSDVEASHDENHDHAEEDAVNSINELKQDKEESQKAKPLHEISSEEKIYSTDNSITDVDDIERRMVEDFLHEVNVDESSNEGRFVAATFKLASSMNSNYMDIMAELTNEFKARIPVYRKEGQCIAARQMLLSALPGEDAMPSSNFVDFAAFTVPARDLSGNFYTIQRLDEDNLAFVMGDCSSQGTKAAYTVAVINTLVEEALKLDMAPPQVMSYLNERLCDMSNISSVALFIGMISEKTGNVIAANAGHCVPIIIDDTGPHFAAQYNDKRLGIDKDQEFDLIKWYLANDDMVVLYSNGILNVKNAQDEAFGVDRLLEHCRNSNNLRADELVIKILNDIKSHKCKRPFRQDVSLICLKQLAIRF